MSRDGRDGKPGARGPQGRPGDVGPQGRQGKSLFELALENGFTGPLSDWIASMRGKDGNHGRDGTDGKDGMKGDKGDRGDNGKHGKHGLNGLDGLNGVNGKDGTRGPRGPQGPEGPRGPRPAHEWQGTKLRFQDEDGSWGAFVDLKGPAATGFGSGGYVNPELLVPEGGTLNQVLTVGPLGTRIWKTPSGGGGGGTVDSVVPGAGIDVDASDPANPEVSLEAAVIASLGRADSAIQPGDLAAVATSGEYGDLSNLPTLGTAAAQNTGAFATAAQGAKADSAVQPGSLAAVATSGEYSDLTGKPTLGTAAGAASTDFATAAQGAKADTAVQPAGLSAYAPLASPAFTGNPLAPTPSAGDTDTSIATTAFVRTPSIQAITSAATVTPTFANDMVKITAQGVALALANPTGTAIPGLGMVIRIKDNGTARAISYDTQYRAVGVTLPATTVLGKTLYLGMIYNSDDTTWDVVAVAQQA